MKASSLMQNIGRTTETWFRTVFRLVGNELAIGIIIVVGSVISAFLIGTIWIKAYTFWGGHGYAVVTPFVGLLYGAFFIIKGLIKLDKPRCVTD